jgi:hypothetical protein
MTERDFWRCTPRRLMALIKVHKEVNTPDDTDSPKSVKKQKMVYIDQIW